MAVKTIEKPFKGILVNGILYLISMIWIGCGQNTFETESELWSYIKDVNNGYSFEKQVGNVSYRLTYRPTDILVKQELGNDDRAKSVDSLRNKYGNYLYFNLSMSVNGKELLSSRVGDRNDFGSMVNLMAFGMTDKVHLVSGRRDTIAMIDYVFPRMYGISNSADILLVYPRDERLFESDHLQFTVEDLGFNTGEVGFKIPTKNLKEEPKLNYKNTL